MALEITLGLMLILSIQINVRLWFDNKRYRESLGNLRITNNQLRNKIEDLKRGM